MTADTDIQTTDTRLAPDTIIRRQIQLADAKKDESEGFAELRTVERGTGLPQVWMSGTAGAA